MSTPIFGPQEGLQQISDGVTTVAPVTQIAFTGATVGGAAPDGTVTISASSPLTVTDGTHSVTAVSQATFTGVNLTAAVSGATPNATITITGLIGLTTATETALGTSSMTTPTANLFNVAIGVNALPNAGAGSSNNVAIGQSAGLNLTGSSFNNVLIGQNAGKGLNGGYENTCIGPNTGISLSTGFQNVLLGQQSGTNVATGNGNFAMGFGSLGGYDSHDCVAIGTQASLNPGGNVVTESILIGTEAGFTGDNAAIHIGHQAGQNATGGDNVTLGFQAAGSLTTGSNNITVGFRQDVASATASNQLNIGGAITGVMGTQLTINSPLAFKAQIATVYDFQTPLTGTTVSASTNSVGMVVNPAGAIAALTIKLPASPVDGQLFGVGFSQTVTAVTWQDSAGGANVVGAPSAGSTGLSVDFVFHSATSKWYIF